MAEESLYVYSCFDDLDKLPPFQHVDDVLERITSLYGDTSFKQTEFFMTRFIAATTEVVRRCKPREGFISDTKVFWIPTTGVCMFVPVFIFSQEKAGEHILVSPIALDWFTQHEVGD